jgi:hypothetical protein
MSEFKSSERFMQILNTLAQLESGVTLTDDWVRSQSQQIREYRELCEDFSEIREDIDDNEFRSAAINVENALNELCVDLFYSRPFRVDRYYSLMVSMEKMCRAFITDMEMLECMEKLGI